MTRAPIPADAHRAAYGAHLDNEHNGARGYGCATCRQYVTGIAHAAAAERAQQTTRQEG